MKKNTSVIEIIWSAKNILGQLLAEYEYRTAENTIILSSFYEPFNNYIKGCRIDTNLLNDAELKKYAELSPCIP